MAVCVEFKNCANSDLPPSVYHVSPPYRKAPARKRATAQITVWQLSAPIVSLPSLKVLPEQLIRRPQILRQALQGFVPQLLRHPVKGFGDAAGDTGKGSRCRRRGRPHSTNTNRVSFPPFFTLPAAPRFPDCPARHGKAGTARSRLRLSLRPALCQTPAACQHSASPR